MVHFALFVSQIFDRLWSFLGLFHSLLQNFRWKRPDPDLESDSRFIGLVFIANTRDFLGILEILADQTEHQVLPLILVDLLSVVFFVGIDIDLSAQLVTILVRLVLPSW